MGIQDNPRVIGNWASRGLGGATEIICRLTEEGYEWSDEERLLIEGYAIRVLSWMGSDLTKTIDDLREEVLRLQRTARQVVPDNIMDD